MEGVLEHRARAHAGQRGKPDHHDGTKQSADFRCAPVLEGEKPDENDERERNDQRHEFPIFRSDIFDGAQHGDRGREHAVAVKQCESENRGKPDPGLEPSTQRGRTVCQRSQREHATLAVIVGAHDKNDVFDRDHDHERPHNHGSCGQNRKAIGRTASCRAHCLAHRVEGAGADIAEDDTERCHSQHGCPPPARRSQCRSARTIARGRLLRRGRNDTAGAMRFVHADRTAILCKLRANASWGEMRPDDPHPLSASSARARNIERPEPRQKRGEAE